MAAGFTALRVAGDMTWITRGVPGAARIDEYERRLEGEIFAKYPVIGLCEFDARRFDGSWPQIIDDLHPRGIVAVAEPAGAGREASSASPPLEAPERL